jgi:hypothetical protein
LAGMLITNLSQHTSSPLMDEKIFKSFDGNVYEIDDKSNKKSPLIVFYPSGENSGGLLKIKRQDFIQIIHIGKNGVIEIEKADY